MKPISEKILKDYQVRKTKKQKTAFIEFLKKELPYEVTVEQVKSSRNLIVGDLNNAEIILSAHYDTAPELPFPNFLTPKNIWMLILFNVFVVFIFIGFSALVSFILSFFIVDEALVGLLSSFSLWGCLIYMMKGKANPHTANDNTSGVLTLIEALYEEEIRNKVACVFFDNEEVGLLGSAAFKKKHPEIKNKLLFNFDCVGDGDTIMLILSKNVKEETDLKKAFVSDEKEFLITSSSRTFYPSDQRHFKKSIGVAAFRHAWFGYYLGRIHTRRDTVLDVKNLEAIIEGLKNYVKGTS